MSQLTGNRITKEAAGDYVQLVAGATIYAGAIVAVNGSGTAVPAANSSGYTVVGIAQQQVTSGGTMTVKRGKFIFDNTTSMGKGDIGKTAYASDDQTVTLVSSSGISLGKVLDVIQEGVVISVG